MKKLQALFEILKALQHREVCKEDRELLAKFKCSSRTLQRYLEDLQEVSYSLVTVKKDNGEKGRNRECYKLIKMADLLKSFLNYSDDLSFFVEISNVLNPEAFKQLEDESKKALTNILNSNGEIFLFQNSELEQIKSSKIFSTLKRAILEKRKVNIDYRYLNPEKLLNIDPIRIFFNQNNWYLIAHSEELKPKVRFFRVNFIENVELSDFIEEISIDPKDIELFLQNIQNPMTLFGVEQKRAVIRVDKEVAIYFQKDSKKFLNSQKFIEAMPDGSSTFSLTYTQPIEILPFIQGWLPHLHILEPKELREELIRKIKIFNDSF
jgi:predicted DNA-binding transcriptional regulator YafY